MEDNTTKLPTQAGKQLGRSGTLIYNGQIVAEDYNVDLTGRLLIQKVEIMRRSSSTVRGALLVVKLPIMGASWRVKPATDKDGNVDDADQEKADYCNRELFDRNVDFDSFLRQGLTAFDFGWSGFEKLYEPTTFNGKALIGLKDLQFRKQSSKYSWELTDGSFGLQQQLPDGTFDIPREKLVLFVNEQEGQNYDGTSLLRYAYKDWDMLDKLTITNAIALEKMGVGVPVISARDGEVPSPQDIAKAESVLRNFRANEESYLDLPSTMQVEMLDMKSGTTKEIIPTLNYHDSRIAKSILAGFTEIGGHSGSGSQSLAKELTSFFFKAEEASAKMFRSAMQKDIIKQLCDFNFSPENMPNGYPQIDFGSVSDDELDTLATSLAALATNKLITPDLDVEADLRERYGLPAMSDEARDNYEKAQELALQPPEPTVIQQPGTPAKPDDPSLKKTEPATKPTTKDIKASALEDLKQARTRYIQVTFED